MQLVDTHCHIHSDWYELDAESVIKKAAEVGVNKIICVGTSVNESRQAIEFVAKRDKAWASVGIHPHDSKKELDRFGELDSILAAAPKNKVVAIGEIGLDYYYNHSPKKEQIEALRYQIELALAHDLPIIFHVRDAFDDFWGVLDEYDGIRGVVHSFSAGRAEMDQILSRNLMVGLNGIMTFTKRVDQLDAARQLPLSKMLLETDAPFLTPTPLRGKVNSPEFLVETATFLAGIRDESLSELAEQTTKNAHSLFHLH